MTDSVMFDVVRFAQDYPTLQDELNNIAYSLQDTYGFEVRQENDAEGNIFMVIGNADCDDVESLAEILNDECGIDNALDYLVCDDCMNESLNEDMYDDFDEYDDVDYDDPYAWNEEDEENMKIIDSGRVAKRNMKLDPAEFDDMYFDDEEDVYEADDAEFEDDDMLNDEDSFEDEIFTEDDEFIDECDDLEECGDICECDEEDCFEDEDEDFLECLQESVKNKKKGCCPPVKGKRLVNLSESLKKVRRAERNKHMVVNESIYRNAMKKLSVANKKNKRTAKYAALKESLGVNKYTDIVNALKEGKTSLYTKKNINGKNIQEYSAKELFNLLKEVKEQVNALKKKYKSLNESVSKKEKLSLKEQLEKKLRLMQILDEELTYRLTIKKYLKEDEEAKSDEIKSEETASEESSEESSDESTDDAESTEETTEEDPEKDEEVELARVIITVANQAAADDLKAELVSAGVPEEAIEFETEDDEESEESEEDAEADTETEENEAERSEEATEDTNESFHMNSFRKLLEADGDEEPTAEEEGATEETESEEGEDTEATDDKPVKVILTDTDHVNTLAQVLSDVYGIEKDEFEEMIGGQIVDDEESEESESEEEKSDEEEEEKSSNGDAAVDNMTDDDLAALFGESAKPNE